MADLADQPSAETESLPQIIVRFAGDSGDGMQLTGDRFTTASALLGNDLATFPDYPAEIRAPAGTLNGVSSFQVRVADHQIYTPGDAANVLIAMNPAALRADLPKVVAGGTIIVNTDNFDERGIAKAGFATNPLTDGTLDRFKVVEVPMTTLTENAVTPLGVKPRDAERSKNFFALGLISWLFSRPETPTLKWIDQKFGKNELVRLSNEAAFKAGLHFGETTELIAHRFTVPKAKLDPGEYTQVTGNVATAWGFVAAAHCAKLPLFLGSYPITPASEILHELSKLKSFGVRTFQAEDEIAGAGSALGAAFAGHLAITTTSGPGLALKGETISLAVSVELPLVIVDVQRGGPSTGLPTKTEAADLNMALVGRHGESPLPVVAAFSPSNCFDAAIEASRIALKYRTPVILLTDGYLANSAHPWKLPEIESLPDISVEFATAPNHTDDDGTQSYWPFLRDTTTLARPWAIPGTPGLMHRVGGIEKLDGKGEINYSPANHSTMVHLRAKRIEHIANDIPEAAVVGTANPDLLVLGWGSTWGAIKAAVEEAQAAGKSVGWVHLTHLNPLPRNLGEILASAKRVIVPELNLGQLCNVVRAKFLVDAKPVSKVAGLPFTSTEIGKTIDAELDAISNGGK